MPNNYCIKFSEIFRKMKFIFRKFPAKAFSGIPEFPFSGNMHYLKLGSQFACKSNNMPVGKTSNLPTHLPLIPLPDFMQC